MNNQIHVENVPHRDKITKRQLLILHNQLKDTMAQSLLQDTTFSIQTGLPYILNCAFEDINRIRIVLYDLINSGESLNINIDEVHRGFKRLTIPLETTTNDGLLPAIKVYIDVWNTFVSECNTDMNTLSI